MRHAIRSNAALAIAFVALIAAVGGGTAIAVGGDLGAIAKFKPPKVHKVKPNPVDSEEACAAGQVGVFCGADSVSGPRIWTNLGEGFEPATYSKDALGTVTLGGSVVNQGPPASAQGIFRLPGSFRPDDTRIFATACGHNPDDADETATCVIEVTPDGYVSYVGGQPYSGHSLDGISFQAP